MKKLLISLLLFSTFSYGDELSCLAKNIYHEARGEGFIGMLMVADVTMNRVDNKYYPNTLCEVVEQSKMSKWHKEQGRDVPIKHRCQFSWFCDGKPDDIRDIDAWDVSRNIALQMIDYNRYRGITQGATHYHTTKVKPAWIKDRGMKYVTQTGNHIFYKWW